MSRKCFKDFSVDNIKKTGSNGYVYDFGGDYDAIAVDDILDRYSKVFNVFYQWHSIKCLDLLKKFLL